MATIYGWFRPNGQTTLVTLRSHLHDLPLHFVDSRGRHARCAGEGCVLCQLYPVKMHAAVVVQWEGGGKFRLLELTRSHEEVRNQLDLLGPHIVGQQLSVTRVERPRGVDVDIQLRGRIEVPEVFAMNYCRAIGVKEYIRSVDALSLDVAS